MSDLLDESVPRVAPLSMATIEELGRCFLAQLASSTLQSPQPLNVCELIDRVLPEFGIHVSPASGLELGDREAATLIDDSGDGIEILVSEGVWENVRDDSPLAYYPRSTICHEIGHAVIHVPALKRKVSLGHEALARTMRKHLRPFEDPEWQAWAFAGAILMPSATLKMLASDPGFSVELVASTYKVSESMAGNHMRRLKWLTV